MKIETLERLFEAEKVKELNWEGLCHVCNKDVNVIATLKDDGIMEISGGAVYEGDKTEPDEFYLKCDDCFSKNEVLTDYQPVECYSRVVGYIRPIEQWNPAKREEFSMRKAYAI